MIKSIQLKITVLFMLFTLAAEFIMGAAGIAGVVQTYHSSFEQDMVRVFNTDLRNELDSLAASGGAQVQGTDIHGAVVFEEVRSYEPLRDTLNCYLGALSISSSRFYAILDGANGSVLCTSSNAGEITASDTILSAMEGNTDIKTGLFSSSLEYALPVRNGDDISYIIYIKDTCAAQNASAQKMLRALFAAALISIAAAIAAGAVLSSSIAKPVRLLTAKAKKLAAGDSSELTESTNRDEFGTLNNALVQLAHARNEIDEKAKGEQIKVETILQNMNDGILAFDFSGKLIHHNPVAKTLLHRNYLDDVRFDRFFREIQADITLGDLVYMKPEGSIERDIHIDNQFLHLDFAVFNTDNKIGGIIVIIHDSTRQERLEQSRRDFVADVSHELRTPLTTIKSYSETLSDMPDCDRELQVRFLNVIASEADRMARIIRDLLTLSELDANKSIYRTPEDINIRDMVTSVVERMDINAKKRSQTLTYHPINEIPIIHGHRDSLERVIINIISNAIKYTPSGGNIEVYTTSVYDGITIKVVDNGIGIPKDKLPHIFDRFYRVDKARSRDTGGTGLGLAIAKQTIESGFNGKININSELNKGTEVTITIPLNKPKSE